MKVGIIGCGLIGHKRANNLHHCELIACADKNYERAKIFAQTFPSCEAYENWQLLIDNPDLNIVIVATPHYALAEITYAAINAKKHVLVEKPAGLNAAELIPLIVAAKTQRVLVRVGFNHRYHRAFRHAFELIKKGEVGELMFVRARYGHGGRIGYEQEWRAKPELSGGGELIDQGVHLVDLAHCFLGEFIEIDGFAHTYFWNMPVDDNGFMLLKTAKKQIAFLHASCTEWKNLFSMEIYGKTGKIAIEGLGGSYGIERLAFYKMQPQMGPPETTIWEYPMVDDSWSVEFNEFLEDIKLKRQPSANLEDAQKALAVVEEIYRKSK